MAATPEVTAALSELIAVVAQLRTPEGGCPWDLEQTHASLVPYVLEEAHEVADAIRHGDDAHLKEELGDLLLQVVLHAQIAQEDGRFDLAGIAEGISDKLIRRHPHVFAEAEAADSAAVKANWEVIKAAEQAHDPAGKPSASPLSDRLAGKVRGQPALAGAMTISQTAAAAGFEWDDMAGVWEKVHEELDELKEAVASGNKPAVTSSIPTGVVVPSLPQVSGPTVDLGDRPEQRVPMSRLRARVAERLLQSQSTNAILTTFNEVNMAPVMEMRKRFQEKFEKEHGVKIGFMSFFVKAAVHALKKYPVLNASVDGSDIVYHGYFDIGIAVGSPRGLVVPILRNADQMSFAEIEKKISEFGAKARDGKLGPAEMTGATFTISSLGGIGGKYFTPIINAPEVAILGVCKSTMEPVWDGKAFQPRLMLPLSLTWDHRVIDGAAAARFNAFLGQILSDFRRVLL